MTNKGFFSTATELLSPNCTACKLDRRCASPKIPVTGKGRASLLIIGEAPGRTEDERGEAFVGESGAILRRILREEMHLSLEEDCWKTNALSCRPPENRTPSPAEITHCRPKVLKSIMELHPQLILLLGATAVESVIGHRAGANCGGLATWRGYAFPDYGWQSWVATSYHPSWILRGNEGGPGERLFRQDLRLFAPLLKRPLPAPVDINTKGPSFAFGRDAIAILDAFARGKKPIAIDCETTGLKPDWHQHDFVAVSASDGNLACAALVEEVEDAWIALLTSAVPKIAHNVKFETRWSRVVFGIEPANWNWDTMTTAHILDNRQGICGLKQQAAIRFGLFGYENEVERYKQATRNDARTLNKMRKCPPDLLLPYAAIDAKLTALLAIEQKKELL